MRRTIYPSLPAFSKMCIELEKAGIVEIKGGKVVAKSGSVTPVTPSGQTGGGTSQGGGTSGQTGGGTSQGGGTSGQTGGGTSQGGGTTPTPVTPDPTPVTPPADKFIVLAVAGQSNSVGYDESDWEEATHGNTNPERLKVLGMKGANNLQVIPLSPTTENMQDMSGYGRQKKGTKGIHLPLATELLPHIPSDYKILIVPVAYGDTGFSKGTALEYDATNKKPKLANPAAGKWDSSSAYYQTLRDRVKYALDLNTENKFAGVIWCQGEADCANADANKTGFQAMVEQFNKDLSAYANRTQKNAIDKSLWVTHESSLYWRGRASSTAQGGDTAKVWYNYREYLGLHNYVPIAPCEEYTNAVNGCITSGQADTGVKVSSNPPTHYGNDAYKKIVAPRVADRLLRNGVIYGAAANARVLTGIEAKVYAIHGTRRRSFVFGENGDLSLVSTANTSENFKVDNLGLPMLVFDESVSEVKLTNIVADKAGLMIAFESNDRGNFSALYLDKSAAKHKSLVSFSAEKNAETGSWDTLAGSADVTTGTNDFFGENNTITITKAANGKFNFKVNDAQWFDVDAAAWTRSLTKNVKDGYTQGQAYRIGILYGWGSSNEFTKPFCRIVSVK